jgi:hypothetical protein
MRAGAGIKNGIIFQNYNCRFDRISRRAAMLKDFPSFFKRAAATRLARLGSLRRNRPSSTMHNE